MRSASSAPVRSTLLSRPPRIAYVVTMFCFRCGSSPSRFCRLSSSGYGLGIGHALRCCAGAPRHGWQVVGGSLFRLFGSGEAGDDVRTRSVLDRPTDTLSHQEDFILSQLLGDPPCRLGG